MAVRLTRCSGRVLRGPSKGDRCARQKRLAVDKSDNTRLYWCASHIKQKGR